MSEPIGQDFREECQRCTKALGLDVGAKTIGFAVAQDGRVAIPWDVYRRRGGEADEQEVVQRVRARSCKVIVIGLPLELSGREGRRARLVRRFADRVQLALGADEGDLRVVLWDERFSTAAAQRALVEGSATRAQKQSVDALAAQLILQGWLDQFA